MSTNANHAGGKGDLFTVHEFNTLKLFGPASCRKQRLPCQGQYSVWSLRATTMQPSPTHDYSGRSCAKR